MGGELFLAGLGGCFMSNLLAAIKARGLNLSGLEIDLTADLAELPDRFAAVDLCVAADGADPEVLEKLVEIADRSCIMMNTLRGKLEIRTRVVAARVPA
jgi:putative redox protein